MLPVGTTQSNII